MGMAAETATSVLVHGAWADATGFDAEIRALQGRGHTAIGFGNPHVQVAPLRQSDDNHRKGTKP